MREIEFRAKDYLCNWHYGSLIVEEHTKPTWEDLNCPATEISYAIREKEKNNFINPYKNIEVMPHTICQYIGLKDKKGKKIFEGDIFKGITEDTRETRYAVIKFGKYKDINFEDSCYGFYFEYGREQFSLFNGEAEGYNLLKLIEIVGNIFDNPELLGESNEN